MTAFSSGPPLLVHILAVTMVNAFFFPMIFNWTGSILYAFLTSVGILSLYGMLVLLIAGKRRPREKQTAGRHGDPPTGD